MKDKSKGQRSVEESMWGGYGFFKNFVPTEAVSNPPS
jgi:hypothetical protein